MKGSLDKTHINIIEGSHPFLIVSAEMLTNEDKEGVFIHSIVEILAQISSRVLPRPILYLLIEIVARM